MEKTTPIQVNLQYGEYFNHNNQYYVTFNYSNDEQKKEMYQYLHEYIIPYYGVNSCRHLEDNEEAVLPYCVDENGNFDPENPKSNTYGGTSIPENMLSGLIKGFIKETGANVNVGNISINGEMDDELLNNIVHSVNPNMKKTTPTPIQVNLQYGEYFNNGNQYYVTFDYSNDEQKQKMYQYLGYLVETNGAHSRRALEGKPYIMPYCVDGNGKFNPENPVTHIFGGTSIPEDLLPSFIKGFILGTGANVNVGNISINGEMDDELLNTIVYSVGQNLKKTR